MSGQTDLELARAEVLAKVRRTLTVQFRHIHCEHVVTHPHSSGPDYFLFMCQRCYVLVWLQSFDPGREWPGYEDGWD